MRPMRVLALALASVMVAGCAFPAEEPVAPAAHATPGPAPTAEAPPPNGTEAAAPAGGAANVTADDASAPPGPERGPVIAVIDSGIRPGHASFAPGQVVAWYDFTTDDGRPPAPWDPLVETPYDDNGHGTVVAAMAAGLPLEDVTPSHAPGFPLAVAKVLDANNSLPDEQMLADAIRWAVDVAGARVVTISIGSRGIRTVGDDATMDALDHARASGVAVFLSAGNGEQHRSRQAGLPSLPAPSWLHWPKLTDAAILVGGANADGSPFVTDGDRASSGDPHVTSLYRVSGPCAKEDGCATTWLGTSFATPLVAGMGARILDEARAAGKNLAPGELAAILKRVAHDTPWPPNFEGHGFLDAASLEAALAHVRDGAPLPEPATPLNEAYVDVAQPLVRGVLRSAAPSAP